MYIGHESVHGRLCHVTCAFRCVSGSALPQHGVVSAGSGPDDNEHKRLDDYSECNALTKPTQHSTNPLASFLVSVGLECLVKIATCNLNQWALDFDTNLRNIVQVSSVSASLLALLTFGTPRRGVVFISLSAWRSKQGVHFEQAQS